MVTASDVRALGTILTVWAHPDDETYLAAGLLAAARDAGNRVVCLTATRGERGTPDPRRWPPDRLAQLRERELADALHVLGVREHAWLGVADGGCADVAVSDAVARLAPHVERVRPDTIVTFGPDGITGHPDHQAVSRWVDAAREATGSRARVLHATTRLGHVVRFADVNTRFDVYRPGFPCETPAEALALDLVLDGAALDRKLRALGAQASQTAPLVAAIGEARYRDWVAHESFVDAERAAATAGPFAHPIGPARRAA